MDFDFTEVQSQIRDQLARFLSQKYDFDARRAIVRSPEGWRRDYWRQFAEFGLLAAPFGEDLGGLGGGPADVLVVMEEFGRALVVEPFLPTIVIAGGLIGRHGTSGQQSEHLTPIMAGERVFAFAHIEAKSRHGLFDVDMRAAKDGAGYRLTGRKSVVQAGPWADHLIVSARTGGLRRDREGISLFLVPASAKGIVRRDYPTLDGGRASEMDFDGVEIGPDALIGQAGEAGALLEEIADHAIAALCAEAVGAMGALHKTTVDYAQTRKQFGQPIASFQVIQHRLVDMFMAYEQSVSMAYYATMKLAADPIERGRAASAAKAQIGRAGRFIGQNAVQIHGGMGMTEELKVGHYFKRLTLIDAQFGDVDHHMRRFSALGAG